LEDQEAAQELAGKLQGYHLRSFSIPTVMNYEELRRIT